MRKWFSSERNTATLNGNGHAGGLSERAIEMLKGGKGKAYLAKKDREAHVQLATNKQRILQGLTACMSLMAVAPLQHIVAGVKSLVARMEGMGESTATILSDVIGRKCRALAAQFREFCNSKRIFRPVAKAEPLVNVAALYIGLGCIEMICSTPIYFGNGLFPSLPSALLFTASLACVNVALSWLLGFLSLRNWSHSNPTVRAWARRSIFPLAVSWASLHGGAVVLRLSDSLDIRNINLNDLEIWDVYASGMLVLIAFVTTALCVWKAFQKCGDSDAELHHMNVTCNIEPCETAESHADARQDQLDAWRDKAQAEVKQGWAMLDEIERKLNSGKAGVEQGRKDHAAFAADLEKQFNVEIAETSTNHTYDWTQAGPTHAGLAFTTEELSIPWDDEGELQVRAFLQHWRDELTKLQTELDRAYREASALITKGIEDIYKHQHFLPEV